MKVLLTAILVVFMFFAAEPQTKRALIIGIGKYPAESGWSIIHGDNDVPLITDALVQKGFNPRRIIQLVNEKATKKNILANFKKITELAQPNDIVYIHFSTHGQQVIDISGDEEDSLDEAIIPFDACKKFVKGKYEGKNHLIDDELNKYCNSLREKIGKNGTLLLVLDACHSGDATRGRRSRKDSTVIRGTSEIFQIGSKSTFNGTTPQLLEWVAISAAMSHQNNYEYKMNDKYYGSLSYAIKLVIPDLTREDSFNSMFELIQKTRQEMKVAKYPQHPMIEGNSIYLMQKVF
ncbi:MAG TPA: caspase family protein [Paludibacter sp.]|jgi:hypothetical protein|nr:caspase family protein [Paludibacter sp.]